MFVSSASLITIVLFCNLFVIAIWFYLKSHKRILQIGTSTLIIGTVLVVIRLLIPVEFTFEKTIGSEYILPQLHEFLYAPILPKVVQGIYIYHLLLLIWGIGIAFLGMRTTIHYIKFKMLIDREKSVEDQKVIEVLNEITKSYKKSAAFRVVQTNLISVPMYFGLFTPRIILPNIELSDKELFYILSHEVTHYYHRDLWVKMLMEIVSVIYWWNPLAYLLKQEIDKILEIKVDMSVTKIFGEAEKIQYLECLLQVAKGNAPSLIRSFSLAFDSRTASALSQRFYIVLDSQQFHKKPRALAAFLAVFVILLLIMSSYVFVVEPYIVKSNIAATTVEFSSENTFLIKNANGGYDVYLNNQYFATAKEIKDSYSNLPIYKNLKEALYYENKK
ncbi:M56 family metallopeptidase [Aminipila sp.]|uniref:M56 family metallopeptidase n=1 Tax=Aminipila sp. TaxID=2060095 RepID=UPI0028A04DB8|nr:M56 family metallopeptidase [Aminipila sp.]